MTWWTINKPAVGEATKKQAFADKVIDNLVHLYGLIGGVSSGASGGSLVPNGSFESDEDADGIPDGWDLTEYTASAGAIEASDVSHGRKAYKFTSPGATGGGALTTSDFFPVSPGKPNVVDFLHKSSVAGIHNMVELLWYTAAEGAASPSSVAAYDSTDNPTSWTRFRVSASPPSNARLAKLRLVGAKNDNATAGTAYFDGVEVSAPMPIVGFVPDDIAEASAISDTYVDAGSPVSIPIPALSANAVVRLTIVGQARMFASGSAFSAYLRFRVGGQYSGEMVNPTPSNGTYLRDNIQFMLRGVSGASLLYMQLRTDDVSLQYAAYGKVDANSIVYEILSP